MPREGHNGISEWKAAISLKAIADCPLFHSPKETLAVCAEQVILNLLIGELSDFAGHHHDLVVCVSGAADVFVKGGRN